MKIDLKTVNTDNFKVTEHELFGEVVYLIRPHNIMSEWEESTLCYRSSVWDSNGYLISAGFPKFFNLTEKPAINPFIETVHWKNSNIIEKMDGSLLIVSPHKGNVILRTRGTVDARTLSNGDEIEIFKKRYDKWFKTLITDECYNPTSFLFEWVSPRNRIVIDYGSEPEWYLVGKIDHNDYSLFTQNLLDSSGAWLKKT